MPKKRNNGYPVNAKTLRPFRLWNSKDKKVIQYRNFAFSWSAIRGAWEEIQWAKVNVSIEVFDITTGQHIATFTMKPGQNIHRFVKSEFNFRFKRKSRKS